MRFLEAITVVCLLATHTPVFGHPQDNSDISLQKREAAREAEQLFAPVSDLYKRKGGGGGGGRGSSSFGSSSSSRSGSSGSSGSGATDRGSAGSNAGGATRTGSGVTPRFGGKYGGGASTPYTAGRRSPRGISPIFAIYPGLWLYGAYAYGYHNPYNYRNRTARRNRNSNGVDIDSNTTEISDRDIPALVIRQDDAGVDESKPVTCLCAQYSVCGCDDDGNYTFLDTIIGDGDYFKLNQTLVTVADVNGTSTILLNGTLPNGTTAAGGDEDAITSSGGAAMRTLGGYWVMIAAVGLTCFVI